SLILMNSDFLLEQGECLAQRVEKASTDIKAQIDLAWRLVFSRPPETMELEQAAAFLHDQTAAFKAAAPKATAGKPAKSPGLLAMANLCQALLSSNEFLYVD
ncbi:MAG TPA: DUF1553 domain-containing protein, partial [Pirellulales bacterium]|nr:DUF1553 domain-containing protein [Pirellulales bacterium]